jgi:DNA polymerase-1
MTWLLLDADMLLYQTVASCETEIEWMPDIITTHLPVKQAQSMFKDLVAQKEKQAKATQTTLCWTSETNFRKKVDKTYKGNRVNNHRRKPVGYAATRVWAEEAFPSECWCSLEGDDVLGILATRHQNETVIWSGDKDLQQIPGKHLDNDGNVYDISQLQADVYFYRQTLTGDTTDGYPGCPGIGPKTAEKLISEKDFTETSAWRTVVEQYKKKGLGANYALTQARLARILRNTEYTFDELQLWTPLQIQSDQTTTPVTKKEL